MLVDPKDKDAVAFFEYAVAIEEKFELAVVKHLLPAATKVAAGSTTFYFPASFDDPILLKRFLNRPVPLRSSMNVKITVSDGRGEIHRDVPLIRMMHAMNEAERLHATLRALPKEPMRHQSTNPAIQLIDRHIASYISPDLEEIATPITGTWLPADIIAIEPEQPVGRDAVAAMERNRVRLIHEIAETMQLRLYPWAPYETFMCSRPEKFGFFAEPTRPAAISEHSTIEPGNLRRLESCSMILKLLDGSHLTLHAVETALQSTGPAPMELRIASARFLNLLQTMARRSGGYGANIADIRLALDLTPNSLMTAAIFGLWHAMTVQNRMDKAADEGRSPETHTAPDILQ